MSINIIFSRRLGSNPHEGGRQTPACDGCPDIWELANGDIAVIGIRVTASARPSLPPTAGCGPDEEIVIVPRDIFLRAQPDIAALSAAGA